VSRRSLLPILLAALAALLTVTTGVAVNVATGGTLPDPLGGYQGWAWPIVGLLTLAFVAVAVLQARQPHPAPDAAVATGVAASAHGVRPVAPPQRVVGERVSTAVDVFRNRVEFCARLRSLVLARATPIISVTGRRGIGKSGLVAKVLADFEEPTGSTDEQVDGLAYLSTRTGVGVVDLARIFHALVRLLPAEQRDQLEEQWANAGADALPDLFAALADRKAVLVLDNVDDLQDPETGRLTSADLISFLTAVCSHRQPPVVVTTSQRPLGLPPRIGAHVIRIEIEEGLEVDDAVELLRHLDADGEAGLRDLPDAQLRQAVEHVHGMPRGLELLVALLAERQTATLQRIFDAHDTPEVLLGRLVSEGFKSLDAVGRDVLRLFALADTPLPVDALPGMLDGSHPSSTVTQTVERLVNRRMLGFERATGRARLHPIDSDYVRRTLLDDPEQRAALDLRLADWLATQRSEASTWRTSTDVAAQRREIRHRLRAGDGHGAIRVIAGVAEFLASRGETDELTTALAQARDAADTPETYAAYELSRGVVELLTGSLEEAVAAFRAGRDAAEQASDRFTTARLDMLLGKALRQIGAPAAAREHLARASALPPTDQASRAVVLESLFELGLVESYLDEAAAAAEVAARCAAMLRPDDPSRWWAWLSDLRALIALVTGDHAAALAEVERGVARYTDSPDQASIGYLLNVRGLVLLAQGGIKEAARVFQTVREDAALLRQTRLEGFAALNLAWTRLLDGEPTDAAMLAREAADRLTANRVSEASSAVKLAAACEASGLDARIALLRQAVQASHGNPDLYQPSEETLARLARVGDDAGPGPARRRQRT
jgi:tetratricopeptide (TPR) repeat protein